MGGTLVPERTAFLRIGDKGDKGWCFLKQWLLTKLPDVLFAVVCAIVTVAF